MQDTTYSPIAARIFITKSKAGHYTVTLRRIGNLGWPFGGVVKKQGMISSKQEAQRIGADWMASK